MNSYWLPHSDSGVLELSSIPEIQFVDTDSDLIRFEEQQLGISIPKYKNSGSGIMLAHMPRQSGVSIAKVHFLTFNKKIMITYNKLSVVTLYFQTYLQ